MPTFNYDTTTTKLELRIIELEDTVRSLTVIVKGLNDMAGHFNEMLSHYADTLGGLMLALPSVARKVPLWPVASVPYPAPGCRCAAHADTPGDTPE